MLLKSFDAPILYSFITVYNVNLPNPFNDWTKKHVQQGFSWRPQSVSFGLVNDPIEARVSIFTEIEIKTKPFAERAILVPFVVTATGQVEITGMDQGVRTELDAGNYALLFETGKSGNESAWVDFTFVRQEKVIPMILIRENALNPEEPLLMDAEAAVMPASMP